MGRIPVAIFLSFATEKCVRTSVGWHVPFVFFLPLVVKKIQFPPMSIARARNLVFNHGTATGEPKPIPGGSPLPGTPYVPDYQPEKPPPDPRLRAGVFIGALFLVVVCLAVTVFGYTTLRQRLAAVPESTATPPAAALTPTETPRPLAAAAVPATPLPTSTPSPSPTATPSHTASPQPTATLLPECEQGYLFAAGRVFTVELLATQADGSLRLPQGPPDAAYFTDNGGPGYAFFLSDAAENQSLLGENPGAPVSVLWRGCLLEESTLLGVQRATADQPPAFDPALPGVTLFLAPSSPDTPALPLPPTPTRPTSPSTPVPQPTATAQPTDIPAPTIPPPQGAIEAEIGFEGKQVTASTITLTISVYNYGPNAFTLNSTDVLLLPPGGSPVRLDYSTPALPVQFPSGASQTFSFNFPNPGGSGIVFQIFNVEFDIDDF